MISIEPEHKKYILIIISFLFLGCEGFRFQGTMCDSLQPGAVSTECHAYSEEEAEKASEAPIDKSGECIKCNESKAVELRK